MIDLKNAQQTQQGTFGKWFIPTKVCNWNQNTENTNGQKLLQELLTQVCTDDLAHKEKGPFSVPFKYTRQQHKER